MASSISMAKLLLMLTILVVCFKNDVQGTTQSPSSSSSSSSSDTESDPNSKSAASQSSSSPSSSSSDLYTEYILRDLLRSAKKSREPSPKHNTNPQNRPLADSWIYAQRPPSSDRYSDVDQADDMNDELQPQQQPLVEDQDDQQKLFNYALWLLQQQQQQQQQQPSSPQAATEYDVDDRWENYGLPHLKQSAPIQSTMQDLSWFDGPVSPKVSPMMMDLDDNYENTMRMDTDDNQDDETENPNMDAESEALLNSLWIKYLANLVNNNNNNDGTNDVDDDVGGDINENIDEQESMVPDVDYSDLDRLIGLNQMIDKRRQKVIKHEDIRRNVEPTTTQKPSTTTMTNSISQENSHRQRQPTLSLSEKAKFLHKATMFNQNDNNNNNNNGNHQHSFRKQPTAYHPIRIGQKEYPMLRPALDSNTKSNQEPNNGGQIDWPSELDENTMAEEESLKQLPKQQQQQQQQIARRQIRDVLTSQLDSLKQKDKDNSGFGTNSDNNNKKTQQQQQH